MELSGIQKLKKEKDYQRQFGSIPNSKCIVYLTICNSLFSKIFGSNLNFLFTDKVSEITNAKRGTGPIKFRISFTPTELGFKMNALNMINPIKMMSAAKNPKITFLLMLYFELSCVTINPLLF